MDTEGSTTLSAGSIRGLTISSSSEEPRTATDHAANRSDSGFTSARPGERGRGHADCACGLLEMLATARGRPQSPDVRTSGPCRPGFERRFVTPGFRVHLLGMNEEPELELLDGLTATLNRHSGAVDGGQEVSCGWRESMQLPRFTGRVVVGFAMTLIRHLAISSSAASVASPLRVVMRFGPSRPGQGHS